MTRSMAQAVKAEPLAASRQVMLVVGASLFIALCARISLPLPFTPVPLTLQNFGVLLAGLLLGRRLGFAALALYLAEGAAGLPVFSAGAGGIAQLLGPTGGYLMAYPLVAFVAGAVAESGTRSFRRLLVGAVAAELLLFTSGLSWLAVVLHSSLPKAASFGLYPFVFAEVMKITAAAGGANRWWKNRRPCA